MIRPSETFRNGHNTTLAGSDAPLANRQKSRQSGDDRGASNRDTKDTKGYERDGRHTSSRQGGFDAKLIHHGMLFEQELGLAKRHHSSAQKDDDENTQGQNVQILFDTGHATHEADAFNASASQSRAPETAARAEQVFKQVAMRIVSECQTNRFLGSGPVMITIPLERGGTGMDKIEIRLDEGMASITLCFADAKETSQQLVAAATQLGRLLQDHLPGRRIKIAQSSPEADGADNTGGEEVANAHLQHLFRR